MKRNVSFEVSSRGTLWWFILCILFIYLVDLLTVHPNVTSGGGNLGLLFVIPAIVVFLLFAKSLWKTLGRIDLKLSTRKKLGWGALVLLLLFCYLEYRFTIGVIRDLGGSPEVVSSRIYRYSWLNQYTNTIFINYYTFSILVTIIGIAQALLRKGRQD